MARVTTKTAGATKAQARKRNELSFFFRQLSHFRFLLFYAVVIMILPIAVSLPDKNLFKQLFGGLFVDFTILESFIGTTLAGLLAFAVLVNQSLILRGIPARYGDTKTVEATFREKFYPRNFEDFFKPRHVYDDKATEARDKADRSSDTLLPSYIPEWLLSIFGPWDVRQTLASALLLLPWTAAITFHSGQAFVGGLMVLLGAIAGWAVALVLVMALLLCAARLKRPDWSAAACLLGNHLRQRWLQLPQRGSRQRQRFTSRQLLPAPTVGPRLGHRLFRVPVPALGLTCIPTN